MAKIAFQGRLSVPHETVLEHIAHARSLGLPYIRKPDKASFHGEAQLYLRPRKALAIVGGGPSVNEYVDELRAWPGDIWALNGACGWLKERGIESVLFSLDPLPVIASHAKVASKAILCSRCHPSVFEAMQGKDVRVFDVVNDAPGGVWASIGTVLCAFDLGTDEGYNEICFFGCEGSYEGKTHAYMDDPQDFRFVVSCGGKEYLTLPELYSTTLQLSAFLRKFPAHFTEKSGGLLRAMVACEEHDIVKVSRALLAGLEPLKEAA